MRKSLALFAAVVFLALVAVSVWATGKQPIMAAIADLGAQPGGGNNPWFIATLFDAYFGFLWFWLWIAYRERSLLARIVWLPLVLLLGNIAMASYMLTVLWRLPSGATARDVLLRPEVR